ncbi:MAG: glycine cleavage system aminomethyltransferase GcvT [Gammaproteobacteria bacterium]|nr:glycine cleavage system aminomethyltransferase GcvT [Gammaproteobacteria bacterium]
MAKQTPLYEQHLAANGKMVDFGGWEMPINYGSQIEEHHQVRQHAGIFDVSHMTIVDIKGNDVEKFLRKLFANDVKKISATPGKALYSCLLNDDGCVIDDLIVYAMQADWFRVVVNASTREKDIAWFEKQSADFDISITERTDLAMMAVQGPEAVAKANQVLDNTIEIKPFTAIEKDGLFIGRTGYTGEDGYEIVCPNEQASDLWNKLLESGVKPCGLGARDTLRLEAGMNLYGSDMDETQSPLESGLGWTLDFKDESRDFIGKSVLLKQKEAGVKHKFVGLILEGKGVLRAHQLIKSDSSDGEGEITSGSFSPTMQKSIAFARVPKDFSETCLVQIRNKEIPAKIVKLPFVRNGKILA